MSAPVTIVGNYLSPYVRKVLACLHLKGVDYRIDPIVPFFGDDRFGALSPLRRIPVYIDSSVTLCDSTVICEYIDEAYAGPALLPRTAAERAQSRWLEEYADSRIGDVLIWGLFNRAVIGPAIWGTPRDLAEIERITREDVPPVLDYLEAQLPRDGFLFGAPGIADVSIAAFFRNASFARYRVDAGRWPVSAGFIDRVLGLECFTRVQPFEALMLRTKPGDHRAALAAAGAPLTADTYGTDHAQRGPMTR